MIQVVGCFLHITFIVEVDLGDVQVGFAVPSPYGPTKPRESTAPIISVPIDDANIVGRNCTASPMCSSIPVQGRIRIDLGTNAVVIK